MKPALVAFALGAVLSAPLMAQTVATALPAPLGDLGLADVRTHLDDDGDLYVYGRLPGGGWLRAEAWNGQVHEAEVDSAALPAALVAALLPAAAQSEPRLTALARITEIETDRDDISVEGYASDGMRIEMEFDPAGRLIEYEMRRDDRPALSVDDARTRLSALGYTDLGFIDRGGRHIEAQARNSRGEQVWVELDEQGQVTRERVWLR